MRLDTVSHWQKEIVRGFRTLLADIVFWSGGDSDDRCDYPETLEEFKKLDSAKSELINHLHNELTKLKRASGADWINNQNGFICVHKDNGDLCVHIPSVIGKQEIFCLPDGRTVTIIVSEQVTHAISMENKCYKL